MRRCFADTFFFLALLNGNDAAHTAVLDFNASFDGTLVTTDWILVEIADAFCGVADRRKFAKFLGFLRQNPRVKVIRSSAIIFNRGLELFLARPDKEWSLTDCISFT